MDDEIRTSPDDATEDGDASPDPSDDREDSPAQDADDDPVSENDDPSGTTDPVDEPPSGVPGPSGDSVHDGPAADDQDEAEPAQVADFGDDEAEIITPDPNEMTILQQLHDDKQLLFDPASSATTPDDGPQMWNGDPPPDQSEEERRRWLREKWEDLMEELRREKGAEDPIEIIEEPDTTTEMI